MLCKIWSAKDLNSRPPEHEACALSPLYSQVELSAAFVSFIIDAGVC